jgi:hypothetical protein
MVFDQSVAMPGCDWDEQHSAQGFARRESTVCFATLLEYGRAQVAVHQGPFRARPEYQRVIAVPFVVVSGHVAVEGPEETDVQRSVFIPPGTYQLTAAQAIAGDNIEAIDLYFESLVRLPESSKILLADSSLNPRLPLKEWAESAG